MRTSAAARLDGRMNVDSDKFICRASACMAAGSSWLPSSNTHRGLPERRAPPDVNTLRIRYFNSIVINVSEISPTYASCLMSYANSGDPQWRRESGIAPWLVRLVARPSAIDALQHIYKSIGPTQGPVEFASRALSTMRIDVSSCEESLKRIPERGRVTCAKPHRASCASRC